MKLIGKTQNMNVISVDRAKDFNGPYVRMYASGTGAPSRNNAQFDWLEYQGKQD